MTSRAARSGIDFVGDQSRLYQALSNLLDNALKFTPHGGEVRVIAELEDDEVRITVADSGPGIPVDQLPRLFDRFWRADDTGRHGVGLGLAIAKGIARAHGGDIEVASRHGEGARFTLALPRQVGPQSADREPEPKRTILVVDDDDALRREITDLLEENGYVVAGAAHGKEALEFLETHAAPDLMLLDLMMPVMDGWELFAVMRDDPRFSSVPLVIMTAVDKRRVGAPLADVRGFLSKPFEREQLLRLAGGGLA